MEMTSHKSSILESFHISKAVKDAIDYTEKRKSGEIKSLKTRWPKFNLYAGGIEWGNMLTFAGVSGSGKSALANMLETDLFDLNPEEKFKVLSFNFEMASYRQVLRKISNKIKKTVVDIKSAVMPLSNEDMEYIKAVSEKIARYDIYYVDIPGTVKQIGNTIYKFKKENPGYKILVILDHTRLAKKMGPGQGEQQMIDALCGVFTELKNSFKHSIAFILLSQLNREIEKRTSSPTEHYPVRGDLFGSDAIYQYSDFVFVIHRPELLNIKYYGLDRIDTSGKIFLHMLKNRDGETKIIVMENKLKYNLIEEI